MESPAKEIPMAQSLSGKRVAVLATDGVAQIELTNPVEALKAAGAEIEVVSLETDPIQGFNGLKPGDMIPVDRAVREAKVGDYDGLLLPGGVVNPDHLRVDEDALGFVRAFFEAGKPVAAICHAPWVLIDAGVAKGRRMTGYKSIRRDLENAGADVVDEEVVVDDGLVTSRCPADMPAFNAKMIEEIAEGRHGHRAAARAA
jgi:protease I